MKRVWNHVFAVILMVLPILTTSGEKDNGPVILSDSKEKPVVDGKISANEYTFSIKIQNGTLALSRNGDLITFGISFKTKGWVAIGFGTRLMDNSHMIICYAKGGVMVIKEQNGFRHQHEELEKRLLTKQAANDAEGSRTLEGELPLAAILGSDAKFLPLIFAYGPDNNVTGIHAYRSSLAIPLL